MYIQPVSYSSYISNEKLNLKRNKRCFIKNINNQDSFQPAFKGYNSVLETVARINFKNERNLEDAFGMLFNELITTPNLQQKTGFNEIFNLYKLRGYRGLMNELWTASPSVQIEKIINKAEEGPIVLVSKNENPIMELVSFGRHGFWNTLFNKSTAPHDMKITFLNEENNFLIEFGFDKHGASQICQVRPSESVYTSFHKTTGNRKIIATHRKTGPSETEYYKKDGSSNGFKNFIQGGPAINIF